MVKRNNYYKEFPADYSIPTSVPDDLSKKLVAEYEQYVNLREKSFPDITPEYNLDRIEKENREWWPARCEAIRQGRGDLLAGESTDNFVYLCKAGSFFGKDACDKISGKFWAILGHPHKTLIWPIVMFHGEVIYFEWKYIDNETNETSSDGNVTFLRRGHRGGCYVKTEHIVFYSDLFSSDEVLKLTPP